MWVRTFFGRVVWPLFQHPSGRPSLRHPGGGHDRVSVQATILKMVGGAKSWLHASFLPKVPSEGHNAPRRHHLQPGTGDLRRRRDCITAVSAGSAPGPSDGRGNPGDPRLLATPLTLLRGNAALALRHGEGWCLAGPTGKCSCFVYFGVIRGQSVFNGTGSRNETLSNNGISHFLEHMFFKRTKQDLHWTLRKRLIVLEGK